MVIYFVELPMDSMVDLSIVFCKRLPDGSSLFAHPMSIGDSWQDLTDGFYATPTSMSSGQVVTVEILGYKML